MSNLNKKQPIGIFDSGVGGLTVLRALQQLLPKEDFIYLGDTARLPYGTKSAETVQQYACNAAQDLLMQDIKCLVVACNTASSVALKSLQQMTAVPVIGVVDPAVKACLEYLGSPCDIGVIATESTIKWHAYRKAFDEQAQGYNILEWPCQLMVALAEQGWVSGPLTKEIIHKLLLPFLEEQHLPALILGCTHFPVFKETLLKILPEDTLVIDSAYWVAQAVMEELVKHDLMNDAGGSTQYKVTDNPDRFMHLAPIFLNQQPEQVEWVHLSQTMVQITS